MEIDTGRSRAKSMWRVWRGYIVISAKAKGPGATNSKDPASRTYIFLSVLSYLFAASSDSWLRTTLSRKSFWRKFFSTTLGFCLYSYLSSRGIYKRISRPIYKRSDCFQLSIKISVCLRAIWLNPMCIEISGWINFRCKTIMIFPGDAISDLRVKI